MMPPSYPIKTLFLVLAASFLVIGVAQASYYQVEEGTTIQGSNTTEYNTTSGTYVPISTLLSISSNITGVYNISYRGKKTTGGGGDANLRLYKNGVAFGTANTLTTGYVSYNESFIGPYNTTDTYQVYGKHTDGGIAYVDDFLVLFDYSSVSITSPANNSVQTSQTVNATWTGTSPFQYNISLDSNCSSPYITGTTSNNSSGNQTLGAGFNYLCVRGYNSTENSITDWSILNIGILSTLYGGTAGYNWSLNASSQNNVAIDQATNYLWGGTIFRDSYDDNVQRGNATNDQTRWSMSSGRLIYNNGSGDFLAYDNYSSSSSSYDMLMKLYIHPSSIPTNVGFIGSKDVSNNYRYLWRGTGFTNIGQIYRYGTTNGYVVNSVPVTPFLTSTDYSVFVYSNALKNGSWLAYRHWNQTDSMGGWTTNGTDSNHSSGSFGITASTVNMQFDDFWVRPVFSDGTLVTSGNYTTSSVDFGENLTLGGIRVKYLPGASNISINISTSNDNVTWSSEHASILNISNYTYTEVPESDKYRYVNITLLWNGGNITSNTPVVSFEAFPSYNSTIPQFTVPSSVNISGIVNVTWNSTNPCQLIISQNIDKSSPYITTNTSNGYSIETLNDGKNYLWVREYDYIDYYGYSDWSEPIIIYAGTLSNTIIGGTGYDWETNTTSTSGNSNQYYNKLATGVLNINFDNGTLGGMTLEGSTDLVMNAGTFPNEYNTLLNNQYQANGYVYSEMLPNQSAPHIISIGVYDALVNPDIVLKIYNTSVSSSNASVGGKVGYSNYTYNSTGVWVDSGIPKSEGVHYFAIEWNGTHYNFYIDGTKFSGAANSNAPSKVVIGTLDAGLGFHTIDDLSVRVLGEDTVSRTMWPIYAGGNLSSFCSVAFRLSGNYTAKLSLNTSDDGVTWSGDSVDYTLNNTCQNVSVSNQQSYVIPTVKFISSSVYNDFTTLYNISLTFDSVDIIITNPNSDNIVIQRHNSTHGHINITGTVTEDETVEASFNGSSWYELTTVGTEFSGQLTVPVGQGSLIVREKNFTDNTVTLNNVGIGDLFLISGQSNSQCNALGDVTLNASNKYKVMSHTYDEEWVEASDPDICGGAYSTYGSYWSVLANNMQQNMTIKVPIGFIQTGIGATSMSSWKVGGSSYVSMLNRLDNATNGTRNVKGVLWWQGEGDLANLNYYTNITSLADEFMRLTGAKTSITQIGGMVYESALTPENASIFRPQLDRVRDWQKDSWTSITNVTQGISTYDINLSGGSGIHFESVDEINTLGDRWWRIVNYSFYDGVFVPLVLENITNHGTFIELNYNKTVVLKNNSADLQGTRIVLSSGTILNDTNIVSYNISGNRITVYYDTLITDGNFSYGSYNDAVGKNTVVDLLGYPSETVLNLSLEIDNTPPASITNLTNVTTSTSVNWSWDNPADTDFNHTMIYINNTWITNTSAIFYLNSSFTPDTQYTISTRTVDTYGNINASWVNQTTVTDVSCTPLDTLNVYVSPTGSGTNGSLNCPSNLTWANSTVAIGGTIYLTTGTYNETISVTNNSVKFVELNGTVILNNNDAGQTAFTVNGKTGVNISGISILNYKTAVSLTNGATLTLNDVIINTTTATSHSIITASNAKVFVESSNITSMLGSGLRLQTIGNTVNSSYIQSLDTINDFPPILMSGTYNVLTNITAVGSQSAGVIKITGNHNVILNSTITNQKNASNAYGLSFESVSNTTVNNSIVNGLGLARPLSFTSSNSNNLNNVSVNGVLGVGLILTSSTYNNFSNLVVNTSTVSPANSAGIMIQTYSNNNRFNDSKSTVWVTGNSAYSLKVDGSYNNTFNNYTGNSHNDLGMLLIDNRYNTFNSSNIYGGIDAVGFSIGGKGCRLDNASFTTLIDTNCTSNNDNNGFMARLGSDNLILTRLTGKATNNTGNTSSGIEFSGSNNTVCTDCYAEANGSAPFKIDTSSTNNTFINASGLLYNEYGYGDVLFHINSALSVTNYIKNQNVTTRIQMEEISPITIVYSDWVFNETSSKISYCISNCSINLTGTAETIDIIPFKNLSVNATNTTVIVNDGEGKNFTVTNIAGTVNTVNYSNNVTNGWTYHLNQNSSSTILSVMASGNMVVFSGLSLSNGNYEIENTSYGPYTPPAPVWVSNTTGYYWANHTWSAGSGNITNSYNVSVNGTWYNSTATFFNSSLVPAGCSNITVWAYNNTGATSATNITNNSCVPASPSYAPSITSYSPADLTPSYSIGALATFEAGSNQSVSWTWIGATEGAGDGTTNSTAIQTWLTAGAKTVTVTCSNVNGSCGTIQWDVTVDPDPAAGYNISGYVTYVNTSPVEGARIRVWGAENTSDVNGYYALYGLSSGNYTILFEKDYYYDGVARIVLTDNATQNYTFVSKVHVSTPGFTGILALLGILLISAIYRHRNR